MASVTLEQSVRPWLSRFGLHTAMRVTCVRYRSVLDACMQARHGWQIELMKRPGTEENFLLVQWRIDWRIKPRCNRKHLWFGRAHRHCFDAGTPPCPTSACRSMQHRFDARASYVGVPEDHLLVCDLSTIVCAKRCVCSSSTCGVS